MIQADYIEIQRRGPTTVVREVHMRNGHGRKTVRILCGNRVLSDVSEPIRPSENSHRQRKTRRLHKPVRNHRRHR
jgi:hypothetical protein